jgi:hypothetical protein
MEKELLAALIGGVVGVMGSLLSVAMGYYLQAKFTRRQFEEERAMHREQLENERSIHREEIAHQKALIDANIKRENNLRMIDMLTRDTNALRQDLHTPNLAYNEAQEIRRQLDLISRRREQLLVEEGIKLLDLR